MINPDLIERILQCFATELYGELLEQISEDFYVERHFLNHYYDGDLSTIEIGTVKNTVLECNSKTEDTPHITIRVFDPCNGDEATTLNFIYPVTTRLLAPKEKHDLQIVDTDYNVLYWRDADHDPRTQWTINALADDITDEEGNFIFPGDHTNI